MNKSSFVGQSGPKRKKKTAILSNLKAPLAENVHALNAEREVREKIAAGWKLRVVKTGKLFSSPRDEGSLFLMESTIEGLREMANGRLIGMSHRLTVGEEYADIWTLIPPEVK